MYILIIELLRCKKNTWISTGDINLNIVTSFIVKMLIKVKFANIINIAANREIIPELLQSKCNSKNIYNIVDNLLSNKDEIEKQIQDFKTEIDKFKTENPSKVASSILINHF